MFVDWCFVDECLNVWCNIWFCYFGFTFGKITLSYIDNLEKLWRCLIKVIGLHWTKILSFVFTKMNSFEFDCKEIVCIYALNFDWFHVFLLLNYALGFRIYIVKLVDGFNIFDVSTKWLAWGTVATFIRFLLDTFLVSQC